MKIVDETWYKELEEPDTFYKNVRALKILDHLTEFSSGLRTVDAVDVNSRVPKIAREGTSLHRICPKLLIDLSPS